MIPYVFSLLNYFCLKWAGLPPNEAFHLSLLVFLGIGFSILYQKMDKIIKSHEKGDK